MRKFKSRILKIDGVMEEVRISTKNYFELSDKDFTIDFWIKFPRPFEGNQFMQNRFLRRQ